MTRQCGSCTLCCKLLPVHERVVIGGNPMPGNLDKVAGQRCVHQRANKGCAVYNTARMPQCCHFWNCRWLVNDDTADLSRPDRSHYVIDLIPDYVTVIDDATGEKTNIEIVQVWCDPKFPDAHRDPALRRYLERRAAENKMALVRYNEREAISLMPPSMNSDGKWHEVEGKVDMNRKSSLLDTALALQAGSKLQ